jgi:pilus assembly protein CpaE
MTGEKIMFVDDEDVIRKIVSTYLAQCGYTVTTATDGAEALRLITADPPNLLVTDVRLPGMTGLELTKRLRAAQETARLPIIMLSGHTENADVLAGYGHGVDEYVTKPVDLAVLGAKVQVLLRRTSGAPNPQARQRGVVFAFIHAKGGVGTTTLAVNTAILLARSDQQARVVLVDLNLEFATDDLLLDLRPQHRLNELVQYDLAEVEHALIAELLTAHESGVSLLAGPASPEAGERITPVIIGVTLEHLRAHADYVVVDLPATFSEVNLAVLDAADAVCIITSADLAALKVTRDCLSVVNRLHVIPQDRTLVVLNRTTPDGLPNDKVASFLRYQPDILVPYDARFHQAADEGRPLTTSRRSQPSGRAIEDLSNKLVACRTEKRVDHLAWTV